MEDLQEEVYANLVRPEASHGAETHKSPPAISRQPVVSARRYRLSLSPLDSLQAEFLQYNDMENSESMRLSQSTSQPNIVPLNHNIPDRPLRRKPGRQLGFLSSTGMSASLGDVKELPESISDIQDWDFILKNSGVADRPWNSDCPSLTTGSTISSRNSSTRSTRSFVEQSDKAKCPYPGCGRVFRDLPAHLLTHQAERPEKCPVQSCEYHTKGFSRPHDRARHTIGHFKQTMLCGFCPSSAPATEKTFTRCDVFLRHLVTAHGVEQTAVSRQNDVHGVELHLYRQPEDHEVATCDLCSEPFDAQGFYEHLRGCTLRQVARTCTTPLGNVVNVHDARENESIASDDNSKSSHASLQISHIPEHPYASMRRPKTSLALLEAPQSHLLAELREDVQDTEIDELTASSRCLSLTSSQDEASKSSDEETEWTEDAGSPASMVDSESFRSVLSPMKQQLVDRLMQDFNQMFDKMIRRHQGSGATGGAAFSYYSGSSGSSTYSSSSFVSRKRSLSGGSTPPPDDNGDDSNKRRRPDPKHSTGKQTASELRFACPYYKRNPGRHQTFTSCRDPGFITVARLKEHLYRRHLLPIQCNRCCSTFTTEPALREHQRDPRGCDIKDQVPLEGFDKEQERKLKSKKRSLVNQSEEDKWKGVYRILFPDDSDNDMPSPYIEYQTCTHGSIPGETSTITRFQEFSRLELPRLVRRTLEVTVEEEAHPLEERLKDRLVDIVQVCQTQLISLFQSTTNQADNLSPLSLSQLQLPRIESTIQPGEAIDRESSLSTSKIPRMADSARPFHNFDSFQASGTADFIPIPAQFPEPEQSFTKHEALSSVEGGSNTPDSGYDSTWNAAVRNQEPYTQCHHTFPQTIPFDHMPNLAQEQSQQRPQPVFDSGVVFTEARHSDLGGYYGLFQDRNAVLDVGMMDPSLVYLNNVSGMESGNLMGQGQNAGNGAVM